MQLQKQESRKIGKKTYDKWVITLPPAFIKKLGWKEGENLETKLLSKGIFIFPAKIKFKGENFLYKKTVTKTSKYQPRDMFLKIYNNLPISEREEVVVVIKNEPITWKIARSHILHDTELGTKILKKLKTLRII